MALIDSTLVVTFGTDQIYIDPLVTQMEADGHIMSISRTNVGDNNIRYVLEFKDAYSLYLFGHKQYDSGMKFLYGK